MHVYSACFVSSNTTYKQCPDDPRPEVAFIGRSNVGKSSLINALLQRKQLAKISKKPGKTALINHFLINNRFYFVDLPGYGWASVSRATKMQWEKMLRDYLLHRTSLANVFLLIDAKIPLQEIDLAFMRWLGTAQIPFSIISTKADKKHGTLAKKHQAELRKELAEDWDPLPTRCLVSAHDRLGIEELLAYIESIVAQVEGHPGKPCRS